MFGKSTAGVETKRNIESSYRKIGFSLSVRTQYIGTQLSCESRCWSPKFVLGPVTRLI
jgi:hypothetical protein